MTVIYHQPWFYYKTDYGYGGHVSYWCFQHADRAEFLEAHARFGHCTEITAEEYFAVTRARTAQIQRERKKRASKDHTPKWKKVQHSHFNAMEAPSYQEACSNLGRLPPASRS